MVRWLTAKVKMRKTMEVTVKIPMYSRNPKKEIHSFNENHSAKLIPLGNAKSDSVDFKRRPAFERDGQQQHGKRNPYGTGGTLYELNSTITYHARNGRIDDARQVFDEMPKRNKVSWNAMIAGYTKNGRVDDARELFDKMPERNVVSWNTMIAGYSRNGRIEDARQLFGKMPERDVVSWTAMISGYAENRQVEAAREVFDNLPKRNVVTWNAMIAGYTRNGRMDDAKKMFEKMPERNVISWNAMVSGYAQNGRIEDAKHLFDKMPERNVVSWNVIIAGYVQSSRIDEACELFEKMPTRSLVSWATMITGFAQNGRIVEARRVFDSMPERNVVSWNAMIAGYAQSGRVEEANQLFETMPDRDTVSWSTMITGYVQVGRIQDARQLLEKMPNPNVVSWTAMITGYIQNRRLEEARQIFDRMPERDTVTWNAMIAGFAQDGKIEEAHHLFDRMPVRDVVSWNSMIAGYAQNRKLENARQLFDKMPERNQVSWNVLIAGYAQNGHGEDAFKYFFKMLMEGVKPDNCTFTSVLSACANLAALEQGKQVHENVIKNGYDLDIFVGNALITMYSKCGSIDFALWMFDEMPERDVISWNAMIVAYAQHGHGKEALQLFEQMQSADMSPDEITFVGVLSACSHSGLVDEGWRCFNSMSHDYGLKPEMEHYACMIDLLGRSGHLYEAERFIENMPYKPNTTMWGALLSACRLHGNMDLAKTAAEELFKLEPQNTANYVLLSNIYAACGRWGDVEKVRTLMRDRGIQKHPGCSWIEVKNQVHAFLVDDKSHPQAEKIYALLDSLTSQIKEAGYVPNTNLVLHDVEEEQKENFLSYHSEKLALAFGLISTSPSIPIRIIKNLRVCGDCHTAIKLISMIVQREIILRDANRFHHFKDGLCTCGDYW